MDKDGFKSQPLLMLHMKKKIIKEGFKFYALCDLSIGFLSFYFILDCYRRRKTNSSKEGNSNSQEDTKTWRSTIHNSSGQLL